MLVLRRRRTRFVVLFTGRVGSTYFVSAIGSHPRVIAEGERLADLQPAGAEAQLNWARRFLRGAPVSRHRAIGFKTKVYDVLDKEGFADILRRHDVRVIKMHRRNEIKTAVSRLTGLQLKEHTGRWNRRPGRDMARAIVIDPERLSADLRVLADENALVADFVKELGLPSIEIAYEELLTAPDAVFDEAFAFLRLPPAPLEAATLKNTSDDLRDAIANFDEVRAHFGGTRYEPMFDEVLVP
jgi:LPS sulfotransferase NodH